MLIQIDIYVKYSPTQHEVYAQAIQSREKLISRVVVKTGVCGRQIFKCLML